MAHKSAVLFISPFLPCRSDLACTVQKAHLYEVYIRLMTNFRYGGLDSEKSITSTSVATARMSMVRQELLVLRAIRTPPALLVIAYERRVQNRVFVVDKAD